MKKTSFTIIVLVMSAFMWSNSATSDVPLSPTYMDGYIAGYNEGKELALVNDFATYELYYQSYQSYPDRFPDYPENFDYFSGKYVGIVEGWHDWNSPSNPN